MKTILLLIFPVFIFAQNIAIDTAGLDKETKQMVFKIIENQKRIEQAKQKSLAESDMKIEAQKKQLAEKKKQFKIINELRHYILELKKTSAPKDRLSPEQIAELEALKPDEYVITLPPQKVQWEQRPKSWISRLFSETDHHLIPFIYDKDSNVIYLKK